jgi:glycine/D-amino acid oxidase-like deaminating enzyme/nitrite reductase/ring-hydroxylating ferredoxin subunit
MNQPRSLWNATAPLRPLPPLTGSLSTEVVIAGAGITGLTAAVLLAERGAGVVVLERDEVGSGETGNTTAHITAALDDGYALLAKRYGDETAAEVAGATTAAAAKIEELVDRLGIQCHYRNVPGYAFAVNEKDVEDLKAEAIAAKNAGLAARWVDQVPLPFATRGAVLFPDQAQFHPREYLLGLLDAALQRGVRVFGGSALRSIEKGEPHVVVTDGGRVQADAVFMATNVPVEGFTTVHTRAEATRTYAIALDAPADAGEGLFWDTADPYHYVRIQETAEGTFLIVGGEDHRVGHGPEGDPFARLETWTRSRWGDLPVRYRWSGQIIEPHGALPMIGGSSGIYMSTGYSGQGMTWGTLGAMIVADLIAGVDNPWAALFDPARMLPHVTTREFVTSNAEFPRHLVEDRLAGRDVEGNDLEEIAAGEGKIVVVGGRKVAASRDSAGRLCAVSPVCTHMKCDVAWNHEERSWDCPCHGSRFDPEGHVLNGPAHLPLERIELGEDTRREGWRRERDSNPR